MEPQPLPLELQEIIKPALPLPLTPPMGVPKVDKITMQSQEHTPSRVMTEKPLIS